MTDETQFHRDFYTGILAAKLAKEGYFEAAYRLYGYLSWLDGEKKFVYFDDQQVCCQAYLADQRRGALLTSCISWQEIFTQVADYTSEIMQDKVAKALEIELERTEGEAFAAQIANWKCITTKELDGTDWIAYFKAAAQVKTILQRQALQGLLFLAKKKKLFHQDVYIQLQHFVEQIPAESTEIGTEIYGFASQNANGKWKYESSVFLPVLLEQWQNEQQSGRLTTPIISKYYYQKNRPLYVLQEQFDADMQKVLNKNYLCLLEQIFLAEK